MEHNTLTLLYAIVGPSGKYGTACVWAVLINGAGTRFVWMTSERALGLRLMKDKKSHPVTYKRCGGLPGGDVRISNLRVETCD